MNIYHVHQKEVSGYDTYSDFVVIHNSEEEARNTHPMNYNYKNAKEGLLTIEEADDKYSWPNRTKNIKVECIGIANDSYTKPVIICSSFHAG